MKVISSIKISEDRLGKLIAAQPQAQIVQVKELTERDEEAEILLTYGWDIKEQTLDLYPNLKWLQSLSAGVDMLPLNKLAERNIILTNVRGAHNIQMAEHVIWSMLMLLRQGVVFVRQQDQKVFSARPKVDEMYGKTVCIVGAGTIGREIARKCSAFDMTVYGISRSGHSDSAYDRVGTVAEMSEILGLSDIVVVVLPLTADTKNFVNAEFISSMKQGSMLINAARGPVTDEKELLQALQSGKISAAALDVFVQEPLPEDSPFWGLENVFITPHIGGRTIKAADRMLDVFSSNLSKYPNLKGIDNIIDLSSGY
ncbi:MAG: glyoxylate reductase [Gracilibacter sp. BRH_c7a]|nr:MAG: glyoxylate reductase [Gracilibacter sp. BRH_c7a]